jgi:hypothetical protein
LSSLTHDKKIFYISLRKRRIEREVLSGGSLSSLQEKASGDRGRRHRMIDRDDLGGDEKDERESIRFVRPDLH